MTYYTQQHHQQVQKNSYKNKTNLGNNQNCCFLFTGFCFSSHSSLFRRNNRSVNYKNKLFKLECILGYPTACSTGSIRNEECGNIFEKFALT